MTSLYLNSWHLLHDLKVCMISPLCVNSRKCVGSEEAVKNALSKASSGKIAELANEKWSPSPKHLTFSATPKSRQCLGQGRELTVQAGPSPNQTNPGFTVDQTQCPSSDFSEDDASKPLRGGEEMNLTVWGSPTAFLKWANRQQTFDLQQTKTPSLD